MLRHRIPRHVSPIVDLRALGPETWSDAAPLHGIDLDLDRQLDIPMDSPGDPTALHLDNPWYGPMDADTLYAMVRRSRPRRVLELGSGFSSLIIDRALAGGHALRAVRQVVDPSPSPLLDRVRERVHVIRGRALQPRAVAAPP